MHPERRDSFFGRRKGKPLRPRQQALMETLLPELRIDTDQPAPQLLADLFDHRPAKICLEIGFGGGEHLIAQAAENPNDGFIGVEPFENGMAKALSAIDKLDLSNVRLFDQDATRLLGWLPPQSLSRVELLYPDPWPKKRHWKRRFVNDANVENIVRVLERGGRFHFASDIDTYIDWTLKHLMRRDDMVALARTAAERLKPWAGWKQTRYEAKAIREGRTPVYLVFERI